MSIFHRSIAAQNERIKELETKLGKYEFLHDTWRKSDQPIHRHLAKHIDAVLAGIVEVP